MQHLRKVLVQREEKTERWDYLTTFKPPAHLSIESGKIYMKEQVHPGSAEYDFVANMFTSTFNGRVAKKKKLNNHNNNFGLALGPGRFNVNNMYGAGFGVANINAMYPQSLFANPVGRPFGVNTGQVIKIEKIYNCVIYEKFMNEFKRMLRKYKDLKINDIVKHLFHGSRQTEPHLIYGSEDGLDMRFSNSGMYGRGTYFADNSQYSSAYHYPTKNNECQMFLAMVLVGDSVTLNPGQY